MALGGSVKRVKWRMGRVGLVFDFEIVDWNCVTKGRVRREEGINLTRKGKDS